jgi:hypothetical protein
MRSDFVLGAFIDWLQAAGTFAAVVAAVGIAVWGARRERQRQPALSLAFDPSLKAPDFMAGMWSTDGVDWFESHWIRLRVENAAGRNSADDVEVLFLGLESLDGGDTQRTLDVVPLKWSSTQGDAGGALTRITIPPGIARHIDLLAIDGSGSESAHEPGDPISALQVWPVPTDNRHLLRGGRYAFYLAVVARDTDAAFFRLEVTVPRDRSDAAEIREQLRVSAPIRQRASPQSL